MIRVFNKLYTLLLHVLMGWIDNVRTLRDATEGNGNVYTNQLKNQFKSLGLSVSGIVPADDYAKFLAANATAFAAHLEGTMNTVYDVAAVLSAIKIVFQDIFYHRNIQRSDANAFLDRTLELVGIANALPVPTFSDDDAENVLALIENVQSQSADVAGAMERLIAENNHLKDALDSTIFRQTIPVSLLSSVAASAISYAFGKAAKSKTGAD